MNSARCSVKAANERMPEIVNPHSVQVLTRNVNLSVSACLRMCCLCNSN